MNKFRLSIQNVKKYSIVLLYFLMICTPFWYKSTKAVILMFLVLVFMQNLFTKSVLVKKDILIWFFLYLGHGLFFILLGVINSTPGVFYVVPVIVIWPIIYFIITIQISEKKILDLLFALFIISTIAIGVYMLAYVINIKYINSLYSGAARTKDDYFINFEFITRVFDWSGSDPTGTIEIFMPAVTSCIFLIPFIISAIFWWPKNFSILSKKWLFIGLGISIVILYYVNRRALWLVVFISIFTNIVTLLFRGRIRMKVKKIYLYLFVIICCVAFITVITNLGNIIEFSSNIFAGLINDELESSNNKRKEQFLTLVQAWTRNPFFGQGYGSVLENKSRITEKPWEFELSYIALLFQIGIVGLISYLGLLFLIFYKGIKAINKNRKLENYLIPVLIGTFSLLFANATNPYLQAYDHMWILFLPFAIINAKIKDK